MPLLLFVSFIIAIVPERKCFHCGYKNDVLGALITVSNTLLAVVSFINQFIYLHVLIYKV